MKGSTRRLKMGKAVVTVLLLALTLGCAIANRMGGISQAQELEKAGEPAQAKILEIWDTGITIGNDPVVGFLLEVQPEGRPAYQAKTKLEISRVNLPQFQPGAVVPVRIDRNDPNRVSLDIYEF